MHYPAVVGYIFCFFVPPDAHIERSRVHGKIPTTRHGNDREAGPGGVHECTCTDVGKGIASSAARFSNRKSPPSQAGFLV